MELALEYGMLMVVHSTLVHYCFYGTHLNMINGCDLWGSFWVFIFYHLDINVKYIDKLKDTLI